MNPAPSCDTVPGQPADQKGLEALEACVSAHLHLRDQVHVLLVVVRRKVAVEAGCLHDQHNQELR